MSVALVVTLDADRIPPRTGRAAWIDKYGPVESDPEIRVFAPLTAWEEFGATIKANGSVQVRDLVLLRQLKDLLCAEIRRTGKVPATKGNSCEAPDEGKKLLEAARFSAMCQITRILPPDSFPKIGEDYPEGSAPWFLWGDPRAFILKDAAGHESQQFLLRAVYRRAADGAPEVVKVEGPIHPMEWDALPDVPEGCAGRLIGRMTSKD